ncbi:mediator of RNA polymerase II transcription subunit 24-like isoform X1 [Cataglyphis hispanica]|uniref:mediator of RNA polymerase II transcription subunit 24-like isoform X1 n=1 Tax=Cataglyphis hispanica TaxID=1086592 RepID=UPI002180330E|nr:mediator of RNA polymerase II transcription subunit 24-like isoform X1 [Cataglyphis hispanica]XP_050463770.1 mediator of RNA polymerase II transcription subunit 24-like isoform X1 [Cataglyphis hispanica]
METKVTSKTSSLKALLLRAWRERWTDLQWGINIKTILPRGVSGDVHNLADCILQQALVGSGPNQLVLSYLKHSLSSQLVSYAAVLQRISKYDAFHKPHCILSLLEFLESIQVGITCRGKPEEDLLAAAVLSIVYWLLQCYLHALTKVPQSHPLTLHSNELIDKPASILQQVLNSDFLCAMMYLAKYDDKEFSFSDLYIDVAKKCQEIETLLKTSSQKSVVAIEDSLKKLCNLEIESLCPEKIKMESITHCLQPLFAVQVLLNPSTETTVFVNQLLMVQRLKTYTNARLYCEIIRACLMCLHNVTGTFKESQWGAFMFLKVPLILKELHASTINSDEKLEYSQDILDAFELLLQFTPLLNIMDSTCSCNYVECLLNELQKVNLVTEKQAKQISARREGITATLQKLEPSSTPTSSIPKVIICAEPTLAGILKTLNADYTKSSLLSMLYHVLNSFELMLAVATVEGKLKTFVTKLIKLNECSKQINEPVPGKMAATRAMSFDVSFLMLCSIVQTYGSDVVLEEGGDSFFEQWVRECMPERKKPKSPQRMLQSVDPARVDALLTQLNSPDPDFKSSNLKWHVACQSAMGAVKELLCAWESGVLGAGDVKMALDGLRTAACCLPVCAAAWLCAYMSITHQDALLKPMNMVQHFLTPLPGDDMQDNLKERSSLMFQIIRKMQYDVHPPTQSKTKVLSMSHSIISRQPILEQLESVWQNISQRGWINIQATQSLESLLNTGGSLWFVTNIVKEVLKYRYQEELDQAVDLAFAIFHLDIENCTLDLINYLIPQYLDNSLQSDELVEPQSSILAKLCVYCIFSTLEYNNSNPYRSNNRKRVRPDVDVDDLDALGMSNKLLRLNETGESVPMFGSQSPQAQGTNNGQKSMIVLRDPLMTALNNLFTMFAFLAGRDGEVCQQTHFIFQFLRFTVQCGKDRTRIVLQGMPQTLVPCLLKALPELFTTDILLRLYDIQTVIGRMATARDLCMLRNINLKPMK